MSATRGREGIRLFVPDRERLLAAAGLKSEARMSALEFVRQHALGADLRSVLARGWRHLLHVRTCFLAIHPPRLALESALETARELPELSPRPVRIPRPQPSDDSPRRVVRHQAAAPRMRMGI